MNEMIDKEQIAAAANLIKPVLENVLNSERKESDQRLFERFQNKFSPENIATIDEQDFRDFTSFKKNEHWSGIHRQNGAILKDIEKVKQALTHLLDESVPIEDRYQRVREGDLKVDGLGGSILTAILATVYPQNYCVLNGKVKKAFKELGFQTREKKSGDRYKHYLDTCRALKEQLGCSFLDLDLCWHLVSKKKQNNDVRVFKLSPGAKGSDWESQKARGVAAIGWTSCGSLSYYKNLDEAVKVCEKNGETKSPTYLKEQFRNIYEEIDEGDIILYYMNGEVVGAGVVTDEEYFFDQHQEHGHQRKVDIISDFKSVDVMENTTLKKFFSNRHTLREITGDKLRLVSELVAKNNPGLDITGVVKTSPRSTSKRPPKDTMFEGFQDRAFFLLEKFKNAPVKQTYQDHKAEFNNVVRDPMRKLFRQVASPIEEVVGNSLETRTNLLSRIPKNDFGRGGIYHYYWGAFYEPEVGRQDSPQLYVIMRDGVIRVGFGLGANASSFMDRLKKNLKGQNIIDRDYLNALSERGIKVKIPDSNDIASVADTIDPGEFLDAIYTHERPSLEVCIVQDEVVKLGPKLSDEIQSVFELLLPVMILATYEFPQPYLDKWIAKYDDESEPGEIEDETITWDEFAAEMNWEEGSTESESIYRLLDLDNDFENAKKQLIFFGAPGTGKTKAALEVCNLIASNSQCIERVQFHQSYSYENFIEGIRPMTREGNLTYEIESGPFVKFCRKAARHPGQRFVFVIDELNRGNLSRIFGELMFLLEYRGKSLPLLYSKSSFDIPENVFIIGTMNSADRSIALVDYALRRRFSFVEFSPSTSVLAHWYNSSEIEHQQSLRFLDHLNGMINDSDRRLAIGHSYLIVPNLKETGLTKQVLKDIWTSNIFPLLEEYFCNVPNRLQQFKFDTIWNGVESDQSNSEAA